MKKIYMYRYSSSTTKPVIKTVYNVIIMSNNDGMIIELECVQHNDLSVSEAKAYASNDD